MAVRCIVTPRHPNIETRSLKTTLTRVGVSFAEALAPLAHVPMPRALPAWKMPTVTMWAGKVSPTVCKAAHFHGPASRRTVTTVAMQGMLSRQKSMMASACRELAVLVA